MPKIAAPRIAVLGAGPIGLEAALYARALQLAVVVYERGRIAEHVQRWGHVRLFTPFGMNVTSLGLAEAQAANAGHDLPAENSCLTGREHVSAYLEPLARGPALRGCLRNETRVLHISRRGLLKEDEPGSLSRGRRPFHLLVREAKQRERVEEADVVLDCTGTYGHHRWMGDAGIPAIGEEAAEPHIAYGLENVTGDRRNYYAGKTVLVLGDGYSAATTVSSLATLAEDHPETWVIWLARSTGTQPLHRIPGDPFRERDRLAARANALATRGDGNVEFHNQAFIDAIETAGPDKGFRVHGRVGGKPCTWDADRLIANIGYTPDTHLYRELQVQECFATLATANRAVFPARGSNPDAPSVVPSGLRNPEPNFFILGSKSYGRNSQFFLRDGFEQIRQAFAIITGRPDLNLYKGGRS